jgi:hypothetical protein
MINIGMRINQIIEGLEDIDPEYMDFWKKYTNADPQSAGKVLHFLEKLAASNDDSRFAEIIKIPDQALANLRKYVGSKNHKALYRGLEIEDASNAKVGAPYVFKSKNLSFWSSDVDWATAFVDWGCQGIVIQTQFNPADVLLDMHLVPYDIGPSGREDEILLKPGAYKSRIVKVFNP